MAEPRAGVGAGVGGSGLWARLRANCTWQKELLPIKMILFLYTGGMVAFLPFLTLQMKQLGITVQEIAIIHAFLPIASILGPPCSGLVADLFGKYRVVLGGNIVITLFLTCMLLQVPPRPPTTLTLTCAGGGHALTWGFCSPCHGTEQGGPESGFVLPLSEASLVVKECKSTCPEVTEESLQLCLHDVTGDRTCHSVNASSQFTIQGSLISWRHDHNTTNTTITTTSPPPPPPPQSLPLPAFTTTTTTAPVCGHSFAYITGSSSSSSSSSGSGSGGGGEEERERNKMKKTKKEEEKKIKSNRLRKEEEEEEEEKEEEGRRGRRRRRSTQQQQQQDEENNNNKNNNKNTQTLPQDLTTNTLTKTPKNTKKTPQQTPTGTGQDGGDLGLPITDLTCPDLPYNCPMECKIEGYPVCLHPDDPSQSSSTFWIYFAIRFTSMFFLASSFTMMDATSLALVKQHKAEFGKQRILSTIGQATVPLLAGILVDAHSASLGYSDYTPAVYLGCSLALVATFIVMRLDVQVETGSGSVVQDLKQLVTKLEIDLFLLMILILGSNWGFIESYLFLYLIELKAPNYLLGLTLTVGCLTGVPVMYVADTIISKVGRPAIFIISFFCYAARHFGYAYMTDPWLVFPYELLEIFTYQIMWVAAATYCHVLAPKGLLATMMGLAGSTHYSLGRGLGSLIGGYLIANVGLQGTFMVMGYISLASGIFYTFVHYFYMRRKVKGGTEEEEEEEEGDQDEEEKEEKEKIMEEEMPMMQLGLRRGSEGFAPIQLGLRRGSEGGLHFPGSRRASDVCLP